MDVQVIFEYQKWSKRGYLSPLECEECSLDLFPVYKLEYMELNCPKCGWSIDMGLAWYENCRRYVIKAQLYHGGML